MGREPWRCVRRGPELGLSRGQPVIPPVLPVDSTLQRGAQSGAGTV